MNTVNFSTLYAIPNHPLAQDVQDSLLYAQLRTREYMKTYVLQEGQSYLDVWYTILCNVLSAYPGYVVCNDDAGWRNMNFFHNDTLNEIRNIYGGERVIDVLKQNCRDAECCMPGIADADRGFMDGYITQLSRSLMKAGNGSKAMSIWDGNTRNGNYVNCMNSGVNMSGGGGGVLSLFISVVAFNKINCNSHYLWEGIGNDIFRVAMHCTFSPSDYDKVRDKVKAYLKDSAKKYVANLDV
ncbi:hypothetical protein [Shewanella sp. SM29]|uniref:hypothetical protein n=1 Tax=Shewanella sp. SM29 TaxID=2912795 RepID=UPI0021D92F5E|nr:hypothetical protein [Shewanella sp. SM29]MCU8075768.1 hypothetical protein [Shewanella sp. SM29]